jgi:hypothetical protein
MALLQRLVSNESLPDQIVLVENVSEERLKLATVLSEREDMGVSSICNFFCNSDDDGYRSFGADTFQRKRVYRLNKKEGRYYSSAQFVSRKFRDWVFRHSSMLDIQNCFYSMLAGYLNRHIHAVEWPCITMYAQNRTACWSLLWVQLGKTIDPSEFCVKTFFLSILMGRSYHSLCKDLRLEEGQCLPDLVLSIMSEVKDVIQTLCNELSPFVCTEDRVEQQGYKALRRFLNTLESYHALLLIDTLKDVAPATLWVHDGMEIMGQHSDTESEELLNCLRHTLAAKGFFDEVKLSFKDKISSIAHCERLLVEFGDKSKCDVISEAKYTEVARPPALVFGGVEQSYDYAAIKRYLEQTLGLFRTVASNKVYWKYPGGELIRQEYRDFSTAFGQLQFREAVIVNQTKKNPDGQEIEKEFPFCRRWLADPEAQIYLDAGYYPNNKTPVMTKNLYSGVDISSVYLDEADKTNPFYLSTVDFFFSHIGYLCDNDESLYNWVIMYFAHMFQFPWEIPRVMVVFYSQKQGTGKSLLLVILIAIIGVAHAILSGDLDSILGKFNGIIEGKLLVGIDEGKVDKKEYLRTLKCLVTGEMLPIQNKSVNTRMVTSFCRVVATTNEDVPIKFVEEEEDRRTLVIKCSGDKLSSAYAERLSNIRHSRKVLRMIYDRFLSIPVDKNYDFSKNRPRSQFQEEMVHTSRSPEIEALIDFLAYRIAEHKANRLENIEAMECDVKNIYSHYDVYIKKYYAVLSATRAFGLKNYTLACKNWLGYTVDGSVVHGISYKRSHGVTMLRFDVRVFEPWFQTKSEFRV